MNTSVPAIPILSFAVLSLMAKGQDVTYAVPPSMRSVNDISFSSFCAGWNETLKRQDYCMELFPHMRSLSLEEEKAYRESLKSSMVPTGRKLSED